MDRLFVITVFAIGILSIINNPFSQQKLPKTIKIILFIFIIACLGFQGFYGLKEKEAADKKAVSDEYYQDRSLRNQFKIAQDVNELKELDDKRKKGLLTKDDYITYIVLSLESIDRTLKFKDSKNIKSWITAYYEEVDKIPSFYNLQEWTNRESIIYRSVLGAINSDFSARGLYNSGMRTSVMESLKEEREILVGAKKRDFQQASISKPN